MSNALQATGGSTLKSLVGGGYGSVGDVAPDPITSTGNILNDGFESGDMSAPSASSGFAWGVNNKTSIVTMNPSCGGLSLGDPTAIYNNAAICSGPQVPAGGSDWAARTGDNSLRFRYPAGDEQTEQLFSLNLQTDLWIRYWIRIPDNFVHGTLNNKWLATYSVVHDDAGEITWQKRPGTGNTVNLVVQDGGVAAGEALSTLLFDGVTDRGKWMQMVYHRKAPTSAVAADGVIEAWRRWEGEAVFTKLQEKLNATAYLTGNVGCGGGFLMGWANDPFDVDTEFLMDDVHFSTETLL